MHRGRGMRDRAGGMYENEPSTLLTFAPTAGSQKTSTLAPASIDSILPEWRNKVGRHQALLAGV